MADSQLQIKRNWTGDPMTVNVSKNGSWIDVPSTVSFGNTNADTVTMKVTCSTNTGASRNGSITISDPTAQAASVTVPVQQAAGSSATTYWNVAKSGTATRNNCPSGQSGSSVTYTVAAHTHSSTASQAAADALAQADVDDNKQAYANANGSCSVNPPTTCTVTYDPQEGNAVSGSPFTVAAGSSHTIKGTTRNGTAGVSWTLAGWATSPLGAVACTVGQEITVSGNITLYARWAPSSGVESAFLHNYGTTFEPSWNSGSDDNFVMSIYNGLDSPWTATSNQTWFRISHVSGVGGDNCTFSWDANPTSNTRPATVTFTQTESGTTFQMEITQDAKPHITIEDTDDLTSHFSPAGETNTFQISSSSAWQMIGDSGFGTVSPQSGPAGNTSVDITVPANTGEGRSHTVQFKNAENITCQVDVWQSEREDEPPTNIDYVVTFLDNVGTVHAFEEMEFTVTESYTDGTEQSGQTGNIQFGEGSGHDLVSRPTGKTVASVSIAGYAKFNNIGNGVVILTVVSGGSGSVMLRDGGDNHFTFSVSGNNMTLSASYDEEATDEPGDGNDEEAA